MFCSNAKNLRYAVFNVEVGREKFMELKSRLMSKICNELEANGRLEPDIYNIAEAKSAK
jgi:hypothetical protein